MHILLAFIATEVKVSGLKIKMSSWPGPYCLTMCAWTDYPGCADTDYSHKRELFPFTNELHPSVSTGCFVLTSDQELTKPAEGIAPENTSKTTQLGTNKSQLVDIY